jgi:hypothetical protein
MVYHLPMQSRPAIRKQAAYADDVAAILNSHQITISDHGYIDPWLLGYLWCISAVRGPRWLRRKPDPKLFRGVTFKDAKAVADFFQRLTLSDSVLGLIQQAQNLEHSLHHGLVLASGDFEISEDFDDPSICFLMGFEVAEADIRRNENTLGEVHLYGLADQLAESNLCLRCGDRIYAESLNNGACLNCGL